ncbi:MAG: O-antigen ligase family protein [Planctomycetota bacterium]
MIAWARPVGAGLAAFAIVARVLFPGEAAGWGLSLLLDAIAMLAAAIVFVGEDKLKASHAGFALCALGLWAAVSSTWAGEGLPALATATTWFAAGVLAIACAQSARDSAVHALVAAAALQAGYAIWHRYLGLADARDYYNNNRYQMRFSSALERAEYEARLFTQEAIGTFGISNLLCAFLAISLPLVVGRILDATTRRARLCLVPVALTMAFAAVLTNSKGGFIAIAAASAVFAWRVYAPEGKRRLRLGLAGAGAAVALGAALLALHPGPFDWTNPKTSFGYRANYARGSLGVIQEAPVLGVGASNWSAHYTAHMTPTAGEAQRGHFDILQVLGELGPIGLLLFAAVAFFALRNFLATPEIPPLPTPGSEPDPPPAAPTMQFPWPAALGISAAIAFGEALNSHVFAMGPLALAAIALLAAAIAGSSEIPFGRFTRAGACAGAAAFFVHGLVEYDLYVPGLVFSLAAALSFAAGAATRWRGRLVAAIPALASIPALLHAAPFMQADTVIEKTREQVSAQEAAKFREPHSGAALLSELREARRANPYDPNLPYHEAIAVHSGRHGPEECFSALDAAIALAPHQEGLYQMRGLFHEAHQDLPAALKDYDRAVELYPNNAKLRYMRGWARHAAKIPGWREEFEKAFELSRQMDMPRRQLAPEEIEEAREELRKAR